MSVGSRRKAREAALSALYSIDIAQSEPLEALEVTSEEFGLADDQRAFARRVLLGVLENQGEIDNGLAKLVRDYDFDRIASIDRNVLRIAAYELVFEPSIPPKVTINEAVEIAKRYSTAESGRFVNGVLGNYIRGTAKANWDPATAPPEEAEERFVEPAVELEEEVVQEDSEEAKTAKRFGSWTIRES
jgi:N utilization substance protein B